MRLLQVPNKPNAVTHAWHNGEPMCYIRGDFVEVEGEAPSCGRCQTELGIRPRNGKKIGKRQDRSTSRIGPARHGVGGWK
jgi:hypothetical protein